VSDYRYTYTWYECQPFLVRFRICHDLPGGCCQQVHLLETPRNGTTCSRCSSVRAAHHSSHHDLQQQVLELQDEVTTL
jgi:hypothetical protein